MSDRSSLSLSDHLALLESQEESRLRGLISGHQSQSLRGQLAVGPQGSASSASASPATPRHSNRKFVVIGVLVTLGLVGLGGLYHGHRVHAQQQAQQQRVYAAYQAAEAAKQDAAFTFAKQSPAFKAALDKATCPLGQKPLSEGYVYGDPPTTLNEKGQGQLVVAHDAEHHVAAVATCGGG